MTDNKLEFDEAQRTANFEAAKSAEQNEMQRHIAANADETADMHHRAANEVAETRNEVDRGRIAARISQVVDYIFFLIYALLAIRLLLELFNAREGVSFFRFIRSVTDIFYWPFRGIVPSLSTPEGFSLELSIVVALVVYALLHMAINGLLRIGAHRKVEI